jgi:[acyl-carrier-protein] S-malonyltransferase
MARAGDDTPGTMAAILGLDASQVEQACAEASAEGKGAVVAANYNSPGQVVISGTPDAVELAMSRCKEKGAKRAVRLPVAGAFHSPLMGAATTGLVEALASVAIADAQVPVIANVDARPTTASADIRAKLGRQLLGAVRWEESMRTLVNQGATGFIELGTGRVLRGLLKSIAPESRCANVDDPASLEETLTAFGQEARA